MASFGSSLSSSRDAELGGRFPETSDDGLFVFAESVLEWSIVRGALSTGHCSTKQPH